MTLAQLWKAAPSTQQQEAYFHQHLNHEIGSKICDSRML
jgi:hypothetical protein